jgi:glycolate oxidase FAD binding subunit
VLAYEPKDLTVSVEAGLSWADLTAMLARERQMIPLDPALGEVSTVGGVMAANLSGVADAGCMERRATCDRNELLDHRRRCG